MRCLFKYAAFVSVLSLGLWCLSLFFIVSYVSPDGGAWVRLHGGVVDCWWGSRGDWPQSFSEFSGPHAPKIVPRRPEFLYLVDVGYSVRSPTAVDGTYWFTGYSTNVVLPLWLVFGPSLLVCGVCFRPWFVHARAGRRLRRGECVGCGYDVASLSTCPECGLSVRESGTRVKRGRKAASAITS